MSAATKRLVEGPLTSVGLAVGHHVLQALGATWRVRYLGREHADRARLDHGRGVFYAFSHGLLLPLAYIWAYSNPRWRDESRTDRNETEKDETA